MLATDNPVRTRWGGVGRALLFYLVRLGLLGFCFASYSLLVDYMPDSWFGAAWLRYAFAGMCAALLGVGVLYLLRSPPVRDILGPEPADGFARRPSESVARSATTPAPRAPTVQEIIESSRGRLLVDLRDGIRGDLHLRGWSQVIGDTRPPGAVGTAYGLRLVQALDVRDPAVDLAQIVRSVLDLQLPGGGWAARSQRGNVGRPEMTAFVLPALVRAGLDTGIRTSLVARLTEMADLDADAGMSITTVLAVTLGALAELAPDSPRVAELSDALVRGAHTLGGVTPMVGWGRWLQGRSALSDEPVVTQTARVVVALSRIERLSPDRSGRRAELIEAAARWLRSALDFELWDEKISRQFGDETDQVVVGHFTAAWVARALLAAGAESDVPALRRAVRAVFNSQRAGVWRRPRTGSEPIWMMYQGVTVLREYALRNYPWPP